MLMGFVGLAVLQRAQQPLGCSGTRAMLKNEAAFLKLGPEAFLVPNAWPQLKAFGPWWVVLGASGVGIVGF